MKASSRLRNLIWTLGVIGHHPLNQLRGRRPLVRFAMWELAKRTTRKRFLGHSIAGFRYFAYPDSGVGRLAYCTYGVPDYDEMQFLRRYLKPGDVFVDVGANIGLYSLLAASKVAGGTVLAFEPHPTAARRFIENVEINGFPNVILRQAAVGDHAGRSLFTEAYDEGNRILDSESESAIVVPVLTLDKELESYSGISAVKVDVEGFESRVLAGAAALLKRNTVPVWMVEVNGLGARYGSSDSEIVDIFGQHGYRAFQYDARANRILVADNHRPSYRVNLLFLHSLDAVGERLQPPLR